MLILNIKLILRGLIASGLQYAQIGCLADSFEEKEAGEGVSLDLGWSEQVDALGQGRRTGFENIEGQIHILLRLLPILPVLVINQPFQLFLVTLVARKQSHDVTQSHSVSQVFKPRH